MSLNYIYIYVTKLYVLLKMRETIKIYKLIIKKYIKKRDKLTSSILTQSHEILKLGSFFQSIILGNYLRIESNFSFIYS